MEYRGFTIIESKGHGKCTAGNKVTSSIQIRKPCGPTGYLLKKAFSFRLEKPGKKEAAIEKAKQYIDGVLLK